MEWQPMETAPRDGNIVLLQVVDFDGTESVYGSNHWRCFIGAFRDGNWYEMNWYDDDYILYPSNWIGRALIHAGHRASTERAGVFCLGYGWPGYRSDFIAFRCTKAF